MGLAPATRLVWQAGEPAAAIAAAADAAGADLVIAGVLVRVVRFYLAVALTA